MKLFYIFVILLVSWCYNVQYQKAKKYEFRKNPQYWYWGDVVMHDDIISIDSTTYDIIIKTDSIK